MPPMEDSRGNESVAVALCLSGDAEGLLREFETVLKSLLHNAPLRRKLEIYVVADEAATQAVRSLLGTLQIDTRPWGTSVDLRILNVQALTASWREHLLETVPKIGNRHTFGSFYRLFLPEVLGNRARHVIYTDPDVVFLTSLSGLWEQRREDVMVCWGQSACAGVMLINLVNLRRELWPMAAASIEKDKRYSDQTLLVAIQKRYPTKFSFLSPAWDVHLANGAWRFKDALAENKPEVGFLHFNGGGDSKDAFFEQDDTWAYRTRGWKLASYYIELPWSWLFYMGKVNAEETGGNDRVSVGYDVL